jgi:hypothetical protein
MGFESVCWTVEVIEDVLFAPGDYGGSEKVKKMG